MQSETELFFLIFPVQSEQIYIRGSKLIAGLASLLYKFLHRIFLQLKVSKTGSG